MIISNSAGARCVPTDRREDVSLSDEEDDDKEEEEEEDEEEDDDDDYERADGGANDEERKLLDELEGLEEAEEEEYSGPLLAEEEEDEEVERDEDGDEEEDDGREVEDVEEEEEGHDVAPEAEVEVEVEAEAEAEAEPEPEPEAELEADAEAEAEDGENKGPREPAVLDFLRRPPELDEGTPQEQAEFSRELAQFFCSRKMDYRPPKFYGKNLNLLKLWRTVIRLGAYDYVTANKLWRQVGETFNPPKKCTTVSWSFRVYYEKSLLDYERQKLQGTDYSSGRSSHLDSVEGLNSTLCNGLTQRRGKRVAARRAMQGWHSKKILDDDDEAICSAKDKVSTLTINKQDKQFKTGVLKRKSLQHTPEQNSKAARSMNGTKSHFVGNSTSKNGNSDHNYQSYNVVKNRQVLKQSQSKPISKGSSYHLMNGIDIRVADEGPEADWVKINVHKTGDCFEVYALVPGLLQEELRVQCEPGGMLVIIGEPEQPNNPWGVTPFKKIIKLPLPIDANQTSAVITLHGQLFVRVPYGDIHG